VTGVDSRDRPRHDWKPAGASDPNPRMSFELQSFLPNPNSCLGTSPHQQGRDTKMATLSFCGIDVSKDRLDVMVLSEQQSSSVPNDRADWAQLIEWLSGFSIAAIGLEASGGYERGVMRALLAAGLSVRQINRSSYGNSPMPAEFWPKMIGWTHV
jgi:transposase